MHAEHLGQAGQLQHPQYSCLRGGQQDPAASPPGAFRRHGQSAQGMAGGELHSLKVHDHALRGRLPRPAPRPVPPPQSRGRRMNSARYSLWDRLPAAAARRGLDPTAHYRSARRPYPFTVSPISLYGRDLPVSQARPPLSGDSSSRCRIRRRPRGWAPGLGAACCARTSRMCLGTLAMGSGRAS